MKYFIGGINGVGKSHFLRKLKEEKPDYEMVDGARDFMKWLGFDNDYEKLRNLHPDIRDSRLSEFISQTLNNSQAETLMYAGHLLVLIRGEIAIATREWLARFDGIVLLTASPEVILNRISHDERDRALFKENTPREEAIKILKDYNLKENVEFLRLADRYGLPSLLINNTDGIVENTVSRFLDFDDRVRRSYAL